VIFRKKLTQRISEFTRTYEGSEYAVYGLEEHDAMQTRESVLKQWAESDFRVDEDAGGTFLLRGLSLLLTHVAMSQKAITIRAFIFAQLGQRNRF
jgi:hypothetical protein